MFNVESFVDSFLSLHLMCSASLTRLLRNGSNQSIPEPRSLLALETVNNQIKCFMSDDDLCFNLLNMNPLSRQRGAQLPTAPPPPCLYKAPAQSVDCLIWCAAPNCNTGEMLQCALTHFMCQNEARWMHELILTVCGTVKLSPYEPIISE